MLKVPNNRVAAVMVVAIAVVLIGLVGCSQVPTSSDDPGQPVLLKRNISSAKPTGDSLYAETIMPAAVGGTLSLWDVQLFFPPNALSSDTLVSISIPDVELFKNHFGTDGLVFNRPVLVVMNYRDADLSGIIESNIKMAWYNDRTGSWDIIDCQLDTANKSVSAFVNHFSAYALISD